jgi:hypothetical protein
MSGFAHRPLSAIPARQELMLLCTSGNPQSHQSPLYLFFWLAIAGPAGPNLGESDDTQPGFSFLLFL